MSKNNGFPLGGSSAEGGDEGFVLEYFIMAELGMPPHPTGSHVRLSPSPQGGRQKDDPFTGSK